MILGEFIIRCSKIDYRDLQRADRTIELHLEGIDSDELLEELDQHGIDLYSAEYVYELESAALEEELEQAKKIEDLELQLELEKESNIQNIDNAAEEINDLRQANLLDISILTEEINKLKKEIEELIKGQKLIVH